MSASLLTNIEQRISDIQFQLQYKLQPLEDLRSEFKRKQKMFWITVTLSLLGLTAIVLFLFPQIVPLFIVLIIGYVVWYIYKISPVRRSLSEKFYKEIVPHIISEFL